LIFDANGKKLNEQQISVQRGINSIPLDFGRFSPGIYFVHVMDENNAEQVIKVLKN
jgi:hypothetical protein